MDNFRLPAPRGHKRTPVSIDVTVNGILNFVDGRITDLSEGGARVDGASMPARSRCEIHYGGEVTYAVVMWSEVDRMGVRFPYELTHGALYNALDRARGAALVDPAQVFLNTRPATFGRRGLS
ncbi:PilZ domain-containing protein [Sphingopyxis sp. PAMC25046]|uniref:PilZ domain-containing protein n=1 Tax=Sphingopyxis sp. PAMC25046 TaxID=2565556 RepID=UPI00109D8EB1|nr:PilZ domain-containing protein [Sphingopyxis sp. PAMC25046]QCB54375.1 PilZ domain-containing protein [Sphingopyxis sp. PAMC25046]